MATMVESSVPVFPSPVLEATLIALKTRDLKHGRATLYDHLVGTADVLRAWGQPDRLVHAGLFHSVYSTSSYRTQAATYDQRPLLETLLGREIEQLVYLFSLASLPELQLAIGQAGVKVDGLITVRCGRDGNRRELVVPRDVVDDLLIVHMANLIDQAKDGQGAPGLCLSRVSEVSGLVRRPEWASTSLLLSLEAGISLHEEMHLLDLYEQLPAAVIDHAENAGNLVAACLGRVASLPELHLWRGVLALRAGDRSAAAADGREAQLLLEVRGTAWDKRLSKAEWAQLAQELAEQTISAESEARLAGVGQNSATAMAAAAMPERFTRYLLRSATAQPSRAAGWYPELSSRPFHDASQFSISGMLEEHFAEIEREVSQLETDTFHAEAENIRRTGRWEVMILFEAGRMNSENCAKVPRLTELLQSSPDVRTTAGLIYLSRVKARTKIAAHRGGSNMRVRLHLGILIPEGDCKLRVDQEVTGWTAGKCMVFDDFYEHEVWNNTDQDRLVLVVDLWHPELSTAERLCLEAIDRQVNRQAQGRANYWETNRKQQSRERQQRSPGQ